MNASTTASSGSSKQPDRWPLLILILIAVILSARWIWIAGIGDYGWTYELGRRTLLGEVPYRDYICTLPPLTSYTIVPFIALLKGNLWSFSLHLYFWWFAALFVGLLVARALGLRPAAQAAAMLLAACLSLPATHLGHAYSYAGTFFFGLTLLELLKARKQTGSRHLLLAGAFAGLGVFAKQNIGMVAVLLGVSVITYDALMNRQTHRLVRNTFLFGVGTAATFVPIFSFFASRAGTNEVFQQMFSDAGAGKGGMFAMLFHLVPLFFFTPETPLRQLWTLVISGGLMVLFFGLVGYKMHRLQKLPEPPATHPSPTGSWRLIVGVLGFVALLSTASLFDLPPVRGLFNAVHPQAVHEFHGFVAPLVFVAYSFFTALAAICLLSPDHWRQSELFVPIVSLPLILWGHEMSCQGYLPFGAALVVPLAIVVLERTGLIRNAVPLACVAAAVLTLGLAGSTQEKFYASCFKPLQRLPDDSKFAWLWARPDYTAATKEMQEQVAPRIREQTTLWLTAGGPHLAWGSKPVFSVAQLFADTYHVRSERALLTHWQRQPPEFVFVNDPWPCQGSQLFTPEELAIWLPQRYVPVWKSSRSAAALWQLQTSTTNKAAP